jgi:hypothetical protein
LWGKIVASRAIAQKCAESPRPSAVPKVKEVLEKSTRTKKSYLKKRSIEEFMM